MPVPKSTLASFEEGCYYHIYNRSVTGTNLFYEEKNYQYFLENFIHYLGETADVYAYCLIPNHFHFLIKIKKQQIPVSSINELVIKRFKNMFISYVNAFNKMDNRNGTLLSHPFRRKLIGDEHYFTKLNYYIHNNPVKHGLTEDLTTYKWSSYKAISGNSPTKIQRAEIIDWFGSRDNFINYHQLQHSEEAISQIILE